MRSPEKVFLIPSGYNFRAVLAFCRALKEAGHRPAIVACTESDPVFYTRFADDVVFTRRDRQLRVEEFAEAIEAARRTRGASGCVLAPASEFLVRWALRERPALARAGCSLPLPDEATYLRVTDKATWTAFCAARGLPVPRELAAPELPCVAKPRWNVSPDGASLYPWLLRSPADLARFEREVSPSHFFFQEWVEGRSLYLLLHLPREGAATVFSQENLAQQPGGKSVLFARSARWHRKVGEVARWEQALRAAGFYGLVMLELRLRGDEAVLIEANPRLWGPLQLCLEGCPALLHRYIAEHVGERVAPPCGEREVHYLWFAGFSAGTPDWHGAPAESADLVFARHARSDVYLRPDSWNWFWKERAQAASSSKTTASFH